MSTRLLSRPDIKTISDRQASHAGNLQSLNDLAKQANANYVIHTGDFGFYDESSLDRIAEKYVSFCADNTFWNYSFPYNPLSYFLSYL